MSDTGSISALGICRSLRKGSFNRAALNAAIELASPRLEVTVADIASIPLYNEDVRALGFPTSVETLRQQIEGSRRAAVRVSGIPLLDVWRRARLEVGETQRSIARSYNVDQSTISRLSVGGATNKFVFMPPRE